VIDLDLRAYCDTVRHHRVVAQVARRVNEDQVLRLLKCILHASGRQGLPQGGRLAPLVSNRYLNLVDQRRERAQAVTRKASWTALTDCRFADDLVVLIDAHPRQQWLHQAVEKRLREERSQLQVEGNEAKSRIAELSTGDTFGVLGCDFRRMRSRTGQGMPLRLPPGKKRTAFLRRLKPVFHRLRSQPVQRLLATINPLLRGWVHSGACGHARRCFAYVRRWVEKKVRRHLAVARKRRGFGWKRWRSRWLGDTLGLFEAYRVTYRPSAKAAPV
jgi:RNA-directed DNA polymerase